MITSTPGGKEGVGLNPAREKKTHVWKSKNNQGVAKSTKNIFWVGYLGCVFVCMMYPPPPPPRQPHNLTITLLLLSTFFALSQAQLRQTSYVSATSGQDTPNCGATVDLPCRSLQIAINATGGRGDCLGWSWGLFWERECGVGFGGGRV